MTVARRNPRRIPPRFDLVARPWLGAGLLLGVVAAAPACSSGGVAGAGGAGGASAASSSSGPTTVAATSASSGGGAMSTGAGGAATAASSSNAGAGGAASSSSSSGSGGVESLDCTGAGQSGGDLVWTVARPHPGPEPLDLNAPKGWHLDNVLTGSTGRVFVDASYYAKGSGPYVSPVGITLDELDSHGAYLGQRILTDFGGGIGGGATVSGVRHQLFGAYVALKGGEHVDYLEGDAVGLAWQLHGSDIEAHLSDRALNADGDAFAAFEGAWFGITEWQFPWGLEEGTFVVKWTSLGGHAFTRAIPHSIAFLRPGSSGDVFLGGAASPGFDLGCGPLAGAGPHYVARLDAAGQCLWNHAVTGGSSPADSLSALGSAADGSVVVVDSNFTSTLDIGCGPMTAAPGGSSFAARLDASGACVWSKSFPVQKLNASLFPSGDLLLSAPFTGTLDFGGGPLTSVGDRDLAVARLDPSGAQVWSKSFGAAGVSLCPGSPPRCNAVTAATGAVVLSGALTGWVDFGNGPVGSMAAQTYAVKLDGAGALLWSHLLPDNTLVTPDPCGAVLGAFESGAMITVDKLAP